MKSILFTVKFPVPTRWGMVVLVWLGSVLGGLAAEERAPVADRDEPPLSQIDREYWAYQPVVRPQVPRIDGDIWSRGAIDQFVFARLKEKQLAPVEAAGRLTLLRRVTFDLTGLPPTREEQAGFLAADDLDAAYYQVLDRLLSSSAYGERWAQHWLDLVRFAETDGFEHDLVRPEAWRYRDWVVSALNANLPYDRFLQLQLAADEIVPGDSETWVATGYLLAGPDMPDLNSQEERRHIYLNGMTANLGDVVLGLQVGCAECHHHKVDPISQLDFYRLRACFETIDLFPVKPKSEDDPDAGGEAIPKKLPTARVVWNREKESPASRLWIRGDFRRPGPELTPQFPRILTGTSSSSSLPAQAGRRRALAEWLTRREHPLTARVMVNRVWQHHFGVGLRPTASDFGWLGEDVSHPELLDWLAAEFMESGWDLKQLHRLMLSSATYRLASFPTEQSSSEQWGQLLRDDPQNHWLGRRRRIRLEGEAVRDAMLAISGELNRQAGGPGVRPPLPPAVASTLLKGQWDVTPDPAEHTRRSLYLFARRNLRLPLLEVFDKPDSNLSCSRRLQSTIAPQALHLLNSEFAQDQARSLWTTVSTRTADEGQRIQELYQRVLGRSATSREIQSAQALIASAPDAEGWVDLCHALWNLNEFIYID